MYDIIKSAEDFMYRSKTLESPTYKKSAIEAMMNTLYEKDKLSEMHSHTVSEICKKFGIHLSFSKSQIEELETAGLLHDIGKIIIPTHIIQKKSSLTKEEYFEITRNPDYSVTVLMYASENGKELPYYHGWFSFPQDFYTSLFEKKNKEGFDQYETFSQGNSPW